MVTTVEDLAQSAPRSASGRALDRDFLRKIPRTDQLLDDPRMRAAERRVGRDLPFTTSQARQALHTSRRVAIPLLEYLDRARVTGRLPDDLRRIRPT